jgi:hypothetical protein
MILLALWLAVQTPDSATRVRWDNALRATTDSLDNLRGALATFRADLEPASGPLVLQRAGKVGTTCTGVRHALQELHTLLGSPYSTPSKHQQADLRSSTVELLATMEHCERDWAVEPGTPARADTLKAWGPYRTSQMNTQLLSYLGVMKRFQKAAGFALTS